MQNVSLDRLRQVANLARSVASALDVDTVLRQVVEAVLSLRPRAFCVVRLVDLERGGYRLAAKGGVYEDETDFESVAEVIPFGRGITHAVAQSGQPVLVPDAAYGIDLEAEVIVVIDDVPDNSVAVGIPAVSKPRRS